MINFIQRIKSLVKLKQLTVKSLDKVIVHPNKIAAFSMFMDLTSNQ